MKTCPAMRYFLWTLENDAMPLVAHPLIEVVAQEVFCMILMAPMFLYLFTSISFEPISKLNTRP